jgi:signal transduction histidine kinase/tetratricopeptide (TPR) repeat protein
MRKFLFLFFIDFLGYNALSQNNEIDSLQRVLAKLQAKDPTYVNVANELAFKLSMTDQKKSIYYINLAISVAKDINYEKGLIRSTMLRGNSFLILGLPDQALSYYLKTMTYDVTKYPLENVRLYNNIGEVYRRKEVFDSSIQYFKKALVMATNELPEFQPVIILSNLGEVSLMQGDLKSAERYFEECLANSLESNHVRGQGYGYYGLAECYSMYGATEKAIAFMKSSVKARNEANHQRGLVQSYLRLGDYYNSDKINPPDSSAYYWRLAEELARKNKTNDLLNESYTKLYAYYLDQSQIRKAADYLVKHKNLDDSIRNVEFISNVEKMQTALQSELILAENKLLKQQQVQRESEQDAQLIVITMAFTIVLGLGFATYQYRKRQKSYAESQKESSFTMTLLSLSKKLNEKDLDIKVFIYELLKLSRSSLKCDRATYWALDKISDSIYLSGINEKEGSPKIPSRGFNREQFPSFFDDFLKHRTVAVSRISNDKRLGDIYEQYFKPSGIESILNSPILIDGKFVGFISYTMTNDIIREWDIQEQRYVGSLADLIVAAIAKDRGNMLELEKEDLIKKLQIRNKSLKEFNSVISHNLREPLTQIIGFSSLLGDQPKKEELKEMVQRISMASNKIDKVIKELSTVLNEEDPKPSDFKIISIEKLIKEVLDLLKNEISSQNITIEQNLSLLKIKTYKPFLSDTLYHLLSNSLKFAAPQRRLHINIESFEKGDHQFIRVSDNGRGIDLDQCGDKIFKMYQRFHLDVDGRGIGLFIVKNRVTSLNGLVKVESAVGEGTTFTLEFPIDFGTINLNS